MPAGEALSPRAVETVVATILHDCVDDTPVTLEQLEGTFGPQVASLVASVGRVGDATQVLRRQRSGAPRFKSQGRANLPTRLSLAEETALVGMLMDMVEDPRVMLIKLADRLHNCRTLWALSPRKRRAVADETLVVWCALAGRLGLFAVKAELEDLCFAVLDPVAFAQVRGGLDVLWTPKGETVPTLPKVPEDSSSVADVRAFLGLVMPFELINGRAGGSALDADGVAQVEHVPSAAAVTSLGGIQSRLLRELYQRVGYVPGTEVRLYGRLKSLYSTYCKMLRKGVPLAQVYDTRALRVVVGDGAEDGADGGAISSGAKSDDAAAEATCYRMLGMVHRLFAPVAGEMDDYIVNPKRSGYQSLHTAVIAPDRAPLEVQIRTRGMHETAEYGDAAHFLYKESYTPEDTAAILELDADDADELSDATGPDEADGDSILSALIGEVPADRRGRRMDRLRKSLARRAQAREDAVAAAAQAVAAQDKLDDGEAVAHLSNEGSVEAASAPSADAADERRAEPSAQEAALSAVAAKAWVGRPMLRVDRDVLLDSITVNVLDGGNELVVATYVGGRVLKRELKGRERLAPYAKIAAHAAARGLRQPGQGDCDVVLERYVLCMDGLWHKTDVYDHKSHIFLTPLQVADGDRSMLEDASASNEAAGEEGEVETTAESSKGKSEDAREGKAYAPVRRSVVTRNRRVSALNQKARRLRSMMTWDVEAEMPSLSADANAVEALEAAMEVEAATVSVNDDTEDALADETSVIIVAPSSDQRDSPKNNIIKLQRSADVLDAAVAHLKERGELEVLPGLSAEARSEASRHYELILNGVRLGETDLLRRVQTGDVVELIARKPDLSKFEPAAAKEGTN